MIRFTANDLKSSWLLWTATANKSWFKEVQVTERKMKKNILEKAFDSIHCCSMYKCCLLFLLYAIDFQSLSWALLYFSQRFIYLFFFLLFRSCKPHGFFFFFFLFRACCVQSFAIYLTHTAQFVSVSIIRLFYIYATCVWQPAISFRSFSSMFSFFFFFLSLLCREICALGEFSLTVIKSLWYKIK